MTTWDEVLDSFEDRLRAQRRALDAGEAGSVPLFRPPAELGDIPSAHRARAQALLASSRDLEQELADNVEALAIDLAVARSDQPSPTRPQHARFIDVSA